MFSSNEFDRLKSSLSSIVTARRDRLSRAQADRYVAESSWHFHQKAVLIAETTGADASQLRRLRSALRMATERLRSTERWLSYIHADMFADLRVDLALEGGEE